MNIKDIPAGAVVVGVDGSPDADRAVDWAVEHARKENRHLVLLCGSGPPEEVIGWMASGGMTPNDYLDIADAASETILDTVRVRIAHKLSQGHVHTVVTRSDARNGLVAASRHASIVVVGSRGRGPVKSLLIGSVSAYVVRHAHCPTVVVRPYHPGEVRRGVLVASDGSAGSVGVVEFAFRQASEQGLPLTVLHTEWDPTIRAREIDSTDPDYSGVAITLSESLAGLREKYPDVTVSTRLLRGTPVKAIMKYVDSMDMVVVGHGRQDPVSRILFGSVALGVLEHAKTIVAVVPQP